MFKKIFLFFLSLLFLLFAYFQWNDPDGTKWILYYVILAGLCFLSGLEKNKPVYIYLMLGLTTIWLLTLLPSAIDWVRDGMPSIVESMKASSPYVELVREFLGLLIGLIVALILLFIERKKNISTL